jgi:C-terminal processing protease CtpA/Prc
MLGIDADFGSNGWKVRSVSANSVASRGKVQAGDIIEAIDGQELKGKSLPKGTATTVTVRRDGKTINLNLK